MSRKADTNKVCGLVDTVFVKSQGLRQTQKPRASMMKTNSMSNSATMKKRDSSKGEKTVQKASSRQVSDSFFA